MNIDEYIAMVEAEKAAKDSPKKEEQPVVAESTKETPEQKKDEPQVTKLVIDGEEVDVTKITEWKRGYQRNDDYTRKTQKLAQERREIEAAMKLVQQTQTANGDQVTAPSDADKRVKELEHIIWDMRVEREVEQLSAKYKDFDVREALEVATTKNINLEDAYLLIQSMKSTSKSEDKKDIDIKALTEEIRKQVLAELESKRDATDTIITTNDKPTVITSTEPKLSEAEKRYLKKSGQDPAEYVKWRDMKTK